MDLHTYLIGPRRGYEEYLLCVPRGGEERESVSPTEKGASQFGKALFNFTVRSHISFFFFKLAKTTKHYAACTPRAYRITRQNRLDVYSLPNCSRGISYPIDTGIFAAAAVVAPLPVLLLFIMTLLQFDFMGASL